MRLALALITLLAAGAAHAESEMLSCQTVNGRTTCVRATGNVHCVTVDGKTRCARLDELAGAEILPSQEIPCIDVEAAGVRVRTCPPQEEDDEE